MFNYRPGKDAGLNVECGENHLVFISKIFLQSWPGESGFLGYIGHGSFFKNQAL
jgi:hypothetical protein